ncbi:MAG: CXXX repeat peptide maturase [Thermoguttaceae bacterium]|jgi:CXXX repeat peptide maturase
MTGTPPTRTLHETGARIETLIVILDSAAVAFCNYVNPHYGAAKPDWMPLPVLREARRFAAEKGLRLIYLAGRHPLPAPCVQEIGKGPHVSIAPLALRRRMSGAIPVLEAADVAALGRSRGPRIENAILRLGRKDMPRLGAIFTRLAGKMKRLNVCLFDVGRYREADFDVYRQQLDSLAEQVARLDRPADGTECNLLTDRLMLRAMNNCDAGVRHLTVAPNGRFYLCPGFYCQNEADAVGSLHDGPEIRNAHLLTVEYAPICRRCDAYQCRRCVLLNKQLTEEANTPSRQQCVTSHIERDASRRLLQTLQRAGRLNESAAMGPIPRLDHLDPFELLTRGSRPDGTPRRADPHAPREEKDRLADEMLAARTEELRALVMELRAGQQEILNQLRQMRKEQGP